MDHTRCRNPTLWTNSNFLSDYRNYRNEYYLFDTHTHDGWKNRLGKLMLVIIPPIGLLTVYETYGTSASEEQRLGWGDERPLSSRVWDESCRVLLWLLEWVTLDSIDDWVLWVLCSIPMIAEQEH